MNRKFEYKCLHCNEVGLCDYRNRGRQKYCSKPDCRRVSKDASQQQWLKSPENKNYFRGAENTKRVQVWRKAHPGYWRKKKPAPVPLQETCSKEVVDSEKDMQNALQETCFLQPALIVGLISIMTGNALQDDIATSARFFINRGEEILRHRAGNSRISTYENKTDSLSGASA